MSKLPERLLSETGRQAKFGTADEEVERVLKHQRNYYVVLKVRKDTESADIRRNYLKLQALLHPDKCHNAKAPDASAIVNQAYDTLTTSMKKTLYDAYVKDVDTDAPEGVSYADWEAEMARPVQLPKWVETLLRIPGGRFLVLLIVLLVLFPLTIVILLIFLVLAIVFKIICLPCEIISRCSGKPAATEGATAADAGTAPAPQEMNV